MAIGKRIKYFRNRKDMTQKQLGEALGFRGNTADVRIAQYESETRVPKSQIVRKMADIFGVSPDALTVPDINSELGLLHTLFALEDMYGFKIGAGDGKICLFLEDAEPAVYISVWDWMEQAEKLERDEISREEYDNWRYNFPNISAEEEVKEA
jgi:transcriptional regulator with XRE-family HTH domain